MSFLKGIIESATRTNFSRRALEEALRDTFSRDIDAEDGPLVNNASLRNTVLSLCTELRHQAALSPAIADLVNVGTPGAPPMAVVFHWPMREAEGPAEDLLPPSQKHLRTFLEGMQQTGVIQGSFYVNHMCLVMRAGDYKTIRDKLGITQSHESHYRSA